MLNIITPIFLYGDHAVCSLTDPSAFGDGDAVTLAADYSNKGADILLIFDHSDSENEHEVSLTLMRKMARLSDIPMWGAGNVSRVEDVKKILYAGCKKAVLNYAKPSNLQILEEVSKRFGREKIAVCVNTASEHPSEGEMLKICEYASDLILLADSPEESLSAIPKLLKKQPAEEENRNSENQIPTEKNISINIVTSSGDLTSDDFRKALAATPIDGIGGAFTQDQKADLMGMKALLKESGIEVNLFESAFSWEDLKTSENGLVPVVVQDYRNEEVLMVAYMNQEAFETTLRTGVMTYWSRSRSELWVKGLTSGHYQYLKELRIDCDNDTLLARVAQVGAACHTGNRSCFYRTALKKDTPQRNPRKVFEDVYATIEDRRLNPKEGSYTNYLFEKGIDKILKKCGEEAAEIIIAAKNPNPEEIKYEVADFLYHMMVLMVERGITWEDIAQELANRE